MKVRRTAGERKLLLRAGVRPVWLTDSVGEGDEDVRDVHTREGPTAAAPTTPGYRSAVTEVRPDVSVPVTVGTMVHEDVNLGHQLQEEHSSVGGLQASCPRCLTGREHHFDRRHACPGRRRRHFYLNARPGSPVATTTAYHERYTAAQGGLGKAALSIVG